MPFVTQWKVRFADVDPASIVFYPRYFEMLNGVVEDWFDSMGYSFSLLHRDMHCGVPTVRIESEFIEASELGDILDIQLAPSHIGRSSCSVDFVVRCGGAVRLKAASTLVFMDLAARKSRAWPEDLREKLLQTQSDIHAVG